MGQMKLFNHLIKIIINNDFKPYNILQNFCICSREVMAKVLAYSPEVSEFELQSRHYILFWTNTLGKCMNPLAMN